MSMLEFMNLKLSSVKLPESMIGMDKELLRFLPDLLKFKQKLNCISIGKFKTNIQKESTPWSCFYEHSIPQHYPLSGKRK